MNGHVDRPRRSFGLGVTFLGVLVFTPDALLLRLAELEPFTLAVWRGLMAGAVLLAFIWAQAPGRLLPRLAVLGAAGVFVAFAQGLAMVLFCLAMAETSAANVLIIFASAPLLAALLSVPILGERLPPPTWAAIVATAIGVAVAASGSVSGASWGDLLALANALAVAAFYVALRRHRNRDFAPAVGVGFFLGAAMAAPFAAFPAIRPDQWLPLALGGAVVLPIAMGLLAIGPRHLPAAEVSMLTLLETALGPLCVWWALGENPGERSLFGGAIVVFALLSHACWRLSQERRDPWLSAAVASLDERR